MDLAQLVEMLVGGDGGQANLIHRHVAILDSIGGHGRRLFQALPKIVVASGLAIVDGELVEPFVELDDSRLGNPPHRRAGRQRLLQQHGGPADLAKRLFADAVLLTLAALAMLQEAGRRGDHPLRCFDGSATQPVL